jgi:hypothetical protein
VNDSSTNEHQIKNKNKNKKEEVIKDKTDVSVFTFDEFWNMYDKKNGRKKSEYRYASLTDAQRYLIRQSLQAYVRSTNTNGRYPGRKDPLTYLNGECWNDELTVNANQLQVQGCNHEQHQSSSQPVSDTKQYRKSLRDKLGLSTTTAIRTVS